MTRVEFLGIGAQKAATSWIHACLYEHPELLLPATKEVHYFGKFYDRGAEWYDRQLSDLSGVGRLGEISPSYLYHPSAAARVHQYNPQMKLIVCLREPVSRLLSAYHYAIQVGDLDRDTELSDALSKVPGLIDHGLYGEQLTRYYDLFPRHQILVLFYEGIAADPVAFVQTIYRFLEVDARFAPPSASRRINATRGAPRVASLDRASRWAAAALRTLGLHDLVWRFARTGSVERIRALNSRGEGDESLTSAKRSELQMQFASDVRTLTALLDEDPMRWWRGYDALVRDADENR